MRRALLFQETTIKRARLPWETAPAGRTGTRSPPDLTGHARSAVVDVDVDGARDDGLAAQAEIGAEHVEQHQDDDDQQDNGETSAASAAARFDHGRIFAFDVVAIVAHWKLSLLWLLNWRNERTTINGVPLGRWNEKRPASADEHA